MRFLRQSTASQEILLGPFVAAADGSAQTGLTIANTDIKLLVGGATSEANKNSGGGTHIAGGRYSAVLDATDTATVGILEVSCNPASGIPWNKSYYVLEEAVYDMLFAGSALGYIANAPVNVAQFGGSNGTFASGRPEVNATHFAGTAFASAVFPANTIQISGDATAADNLETAYDDTAGQVRWNGIVDQGTAQSATGTTLVLRSAAAFADDELIGATIVITGGSTGVGQSRLITDYVSTTDTATVGTWTVTPTGTITYKIYGTAPSAAGGGGGDATEAKQDTIIALIGTPAGASVSADIAAIEAQTDDIGTAGAGLTAVPWNSAWDAEVQSECADAITAAALATAANLATVAGYLDTEIAAILADTSELQTDWANGGRLDLILDARASQTSVDTIDDLLDTEVAALTTELAKVPKSDGTATWNATALAAMQQQAEDALAAYDPPTNTELTARTLASASYATAAAQATAQADLDTLTGSDGVTLATSQPNYAPATAAGLATAQSDLDTITGSDGVTLATTQGNYAPATAAALATAQGTIDKLDDTLEDDGGTFRFTENALEEAPSGGGGGPTAGEIADAVWEEALGDHSGTSGSTAEALAAAGGSGDPWVTPLPGAYSAGQAGYIIGTNINATVSSRASQTSVDDLPTNAELNAALDPLPTAAENATAVWGAGARTLTALDEDSTTLDIDAAVRAAVGMSSANLDSQLGDLPTAAEGATAVWAAGTRVLTAGTNIVLAKGTGVTGFNDLSAAQVNAEADQAIADAALATATNLAALDAKVDDLPTNAELGAALDPLPTAGENAAAVLGATVEGAVTVVQSIRLANAALGGKASGLETTEATYRDLADIKDRIVATVDSDGNRTAMTRDLT